MEYSDGFVPIMAIFYAVFHPTQGTKILHQVPSGSINTNAKLATPSSPSSLSPDTSLTPLFSFDTVKNYIIPKPQLCDKLISFKVDCYRVLGYPVNIQNSDYARNSFSFNFCFVFPYDSDTTPYELCIRRIGKMFRVLEEQSFMLSKLDKNLVYFQNRPIELSNPPPVSATPGQIKTKKISLSLIELLIQQIFQDLNNYLECCIPLDSANSIDIKLFPILPPPINIKAFQVPVTTVNLAQLVDVNWDPTMLKILPYINGLNSIRRISELADSDYLLTKQCIQHLMHYKCIEMLDIFQFSNIYAPTNHIGNFLRLGGVAAECQAYVITDTDVLSAGPSGSTGNSQLAQLVYLAQLVLAPRAATADSPALSHNSPSSITVGSSGISVSPLSRGSYLQKKFTAAATSASLGANGLGDTSAATPKNNGRSINVPTKTNLFYLYRSLNQGQTIREWYIQHRKLLANIDVRRFITFGVLHGLIYRVRSFPILNKPIGTGSPEFNELMASLNITAKPASRVSSTLTYATLEPPTGGSSSKFMKSKVQESSLKAGPSGAVTGPASRRVSFNYNIERPKAKPERYSFRNNDESDTESDTNSDSDSDSDVDSERTSSSTKRKARRRSENKNSNLDNANDAAATAEVELDAESSQRRNEYINLLKLLKGYQHFDSICTELQKPRSAVEEMLEDLGSYSVINA